MEMPNKVYDLIGIGFGPSNLALAVALKESELIRSSLFFEAQQEFCWHAGMLLEDVRMQTPFLKDLVSLQNPCSRFSFLNFLKEKGRLLEFVSLKNFFPSRIEFNQYLNWAATQVAESVIYGKRVIGLKPHSSKGNGIFDQVIVEVLDNKINKISCYKTKNIVLGIGAMPFIPNDCDIHHDKSLHSGSFINSISRMCPDKQGCHRFAVIGGGQSAAEISLYLLNEYKNAETTIISRSFIFHTIDTNPLINNLYSYVASKKFYKLQQPAKKIFLEDLASSNYAAVDSPLIHTLARKNYERELIGLHPLKLMPFNEIKSSKVIAGNVKIRLKNRLNNKYGNYIFNFLCFATGYKNIQHFKLLHKLEKYLVIDIEGNYHLNNNYRIRSRYPFTAGIYLQGSSPHSHGFIEGTIADLAGRSQCIINHIYQRS